MYRWLLACTPRNRKKPLAVSTPVHRPSRATGRASDRPDLMPKRGASKAAPAAKVATGNLDALRKSLPEAPTFTPTAAEFENPLRYLLSIREEAEKFGICCIKPPPSWKPPFMLDLNKLKFPTRVQKINELLVRLRARDTGRPPCLH